MSKKIPNKGGSSSQIKNTNKSIEENILDIIHEISKKQYSYDFRVPVDVKALGLSDYYDIIPKPMDLSTLKNNFLDGEYKTIQDVWDAFDLIVTNCKTYNRLPEHPINAKADQMKARVDKAFQKLIEDFVAIDVNIKDYQLQVDHSELKAKEEKKRKVKLDGLDEKNILMGSDKRQNLAPGSLNEKKLFDLQNPENQIQMMPQQRQASQMSQSLSLAEENLFQPNQLKNGTSSINKESYLQQQLSFQAPSWVDPENSTGSLTFKNKKAEKDKEKELLDAKKQRKNFLLGKKKQFGEVIATSKHLRNQIQRSYQDFVRKEMELLEDTNGETKRIPGDGKRREDEDDQDDIVIRKKGNGFDDCTSETVRSFTTPMKQDGADSVLSKNFESDEEEFKPKELQIIKQTAQKSSTATITQNGKTPEKKTVSPERQKKLEGGAGGQGIGHSGQNSVSKSQTQHSSQHNGESAKKKEEHHKLKLLPAAPELKKNQSQMAAQILQMGQEKKNRALEELKKTEELKLLEEKRKRERMLKKKEQRLLQGYQNKNNLKEELQNNGSSNNTNNLIKIPMNNADKTNNLKLNSNMIKIENNTNNTDAINSNVAMASAGSNPATLASSDFNKIRILNSTINQQSKNSNQLPQQPAGAVPSSQQTNSVINNNPPQNVVLIPQISIGGERLDFKFSFDRKSLKSRYDKMIIRKQEKYKKILNLSLQKMQKVTSWMISEWQKIKKEIKSETLEYFKVILNDRLKIKDNLDIRKIQLLLKMFLYRLRDFYKDLQEDQIEKIKIFSERMYKIASRAIVYKTPLPYRDNPLNAAIDPQVSNTVILEESHPLKKLQEEILEIEREMKYFRRMLQRDIQKYQEVDEQQTEPSTNTNKIPNKKKPKEEGKQFSGIGEGDINGYPGQGVIGYDEVRDLNAVPNAEKEPQQKQSELMQYFIDYNKEFESKVSDLSRIRQFLAGELQTSNNEQMYKDSLEHDICETTIEDSYQNQVDIIEYIQKKRKIGRNNKKSDKSEMEDEDGNILEEVIKKEEEVEFQQEGEEVNRDQEVELADDDIFMEGFTFELNVEEVEQQQKYQKFEEFKILLESSDDEGEETQEEQRYLAYQQTLARSREEKKLQLHDPSIEAIENDLLPTSKSSLKYLGAITRLSSSFCQQIPFNPLHQNRDYILVEADQFELLRVQLVTPDSTQKDNLPLIIHHLTQKVPRLTANPLIKQFHLQGIVQFTVKLKAKVQKNVNAAEIIPARQSNSQHISPIKVQIKNTLTDISNAYISSSVSINSVLLADCFFNGQDYSDLCPEDVESVVLGLPPRTSFKDFQTSSSNRSHSEYITSQFYDNVSASNVTSKMEQPDQSKENRIQTLASEITITIPIVNITDMEVSINNYEIFNPVQLRQAQRR